MFNSNIKIKEDKDPQELFFVINSIEKKYPVEKWIINNIHIWPIVRVELFKKLYDYYYYKNYCHNKRKNKNYYLSIVYRELKTFLYSVFFNTLHCFKNFNSVNRKVDVVFLSDGYRYVELLGKSYDRICGPIADIINNSTMSYTTFIRGHQFIKNPCLPVKYIQHYLSFYGMIGYRFSLIKNKKIKLILPQYNEVLEYLKAKNLPCDLMSIKDIIKFVFQIRSNADFYKRQLISLKPTVAFESVYSYSFNLACKEMGIKCIDVQHGVQGRYHYSYASWLNVPQNGYELLPDLFLTWCKSDSDLINDWASNTNGSHKALELGNLFVDKWIRGEDCVITKYDNFIKKILARKGLHNVLYTLHGNECESEINRLLSYVNKTVDSYYWLIRCHPCRKNQKKIIDKKIKIYNIKNAEVTLSTELPLYAILRNVAVHITESSSVSLEAELFNVSTIVTSKLGLKYYKHLYEKELLSYAKDYNDLIRLMNFYLLKPKKQLICNCSKVNPFEILNAVLNITK